MTIVSLKTYILDCFEKLFGTLQEKLSAVAFSGSYNDLSNKLSFDNTPTANSTNPVTSGGIKTAIDTAINSIGYETVADTTTIIADIEYGWFYAEDALTYFEPDDSEYRVTVDGVEYPNLKMVLKIQPNLYVLGNIEAGNSDASGSPSFGVLINTYSEEISCWFETEGSHTVKIERKTSADEDEKVFIATYGVTEYEDLYEAIEDGKAIFVYCNVSNNAISSPGENNADYNYYCPVVSSIYGDLINLEGIFYMHSKLRYLRFFMWDDSVWDVATTNLIYNGVDSGYATVAASAYSVKRAYDLANSKQNALTFDSVPTANSSNPVTSRGIKAALDNKADAADIPTKTSDLTNDSGLISTALIELASIGPMSEMMSDVSGIIGGTNVNVYSSDPGSALASQLIAAASRTGDVYLNDTSVLMTHTTIEDDGELSYLFTYNLDSSQSGAMLGFDRNYSTEPVYLILLTEDEEEDSGYNLTCVSDESLEDETWVLGYTNVDSTPVEYSSNLITSGGVYTALSGKMDKYDAVIKLQFNGSGSYTNPVLVSGDFNSVKAKIQSYEFPNIKIFATYDYGDEPWTSEIYAYDIGIYNNTVDIYAKPMHSDDIELMWSANGVTVV